MGMKRHHAEMVELEIEDVSFTPHDRPDSCAGTMTGYYLRKAHAADPRNAEWLRRMKAEADRLEAARAQMDAEEAKATPQEPEVDVAEMVRRMMN
jgi:hypothetical protein